MNSVASVYNEDDSDVKIMNYTIKNEDYRRQGETILTWVDSDGITYALSFQEKNMTQEVLEEICKIQRKSLKDIGYDDADDTSDLPMPSKSNLHEILLEIMHGNKNRSSSRILTSDFLVKLRNVFEDCNEDKILLEALFCIYKQLCKGYIVHLNSNEIVEVLLSDSEFSVVLAALENDPGLNGVVFSLREAYDRVKLNNVLGIADQDLLGKVKKAHKLQFIRETALARSLDDCASTHLFIIQQNL